MDKKDSAKIRDLTVRQGSEVRGGSISLLSNAAGNTIKTIGESLTTVARKV